MASTPIKADPLMFGRECTSTDGWTPQDHIDGVVRIMSEEVARLTAQRDRLRDYIIEIEPDAFAHRSGFERGSPDDFDPQDYRRRHGLQSSDMTD